MRGAYFKATNSLAFDQEAQRIRARFGHEGMDWYVSLLCLLINQADGTLDVSDDEGWAYVALMLGADVESLRRFALYLAGRGLLDAVALGDGLLRSPLVTDALREFEQQRERFVKAGKASAAARKKRAKDMG